MNTRLCLIYMPLGIIMLNKHRSGEHTIIRYKEHSIEEHKMKNHKVLVNLAKDPSSSHFSGNECNAYIYTAKTRFTGITVAYIQSHSDNRSQARDLTHRRQTV